MNVKFIKSKKFLFIILAIAILLVVISIIFSKKSYETINIGNNQAFLCYVFVTCILQMYYIIFPFDFLKNLLQIEQLFVPLHSFLYYYLLIAILLYQLHLHLKLLDIQLVNCIFFPYFHFL